MAAELPVLKPALLVGKLVADGRETLIIMIHTIYLLRIIFTVLATFFYGMNIHMKRNETLSRKIQNAFFSVIVLHCLSVCLDDTLFSKMNL